MSTERSGPGGVERRGHERVNLNLTRNLSVLGETRQLPIPNVSYGGLCLLSSEPHQADAFLAIACRDVRMTIRVLDGSPVVTDPGI